MTKIDQYEKNADFCAGHRVGYNIGNKAGFKAAIDQIIEHCREQAEQYAELSKQSHKCKKEWSNKALAIVDFKLYIEQLYKMYAVESKHE